MSNTVQVPTALFRKFIRVGEAFDSFSDALEDFLIAHNPKLLQELRRARREHLAGKTRPFAEFEKELSHTTRRG
ncbi:MAG: hypothetical protein ACRD3T_08520 [Terriglobia bacterium]